MTTSFAVVPVLIGPLQILLTVLPGLILAAITAFLSLLRPRAIFHGSQILWRQKVQVALLGLLGYGVFQGAAWLWQAYRPLPDVPEAVAGGDWPMAGGSLTRRGFVPGAADPTRGGVNWSHNRNQLGTKEMFLSTPAVVGNRVYVTTATFRGASTQGKLYCFDADTGARVWELEPADDFVATFSSPVVAGHYLVCGEGLHDTRKARIVCVDLRNERQPKVVWMHQTASHVECTPVIDGTRVYVNAGDDGTYCIALEPDANGKPRVLWHTDGNKYLDSETSLAVHDGKVYVGLGLDGMALVELDADTGKELRRLDFNLPVFSPPAVADGKLYVAMGWGDYVNDWKTAGHNQTEKWKVLLKDGKIGKAELRRRTSGIVAGGEVCCIDLKSWRVDWTYKTKETVLGAVAVAGNQLYCGARDGHVYCLDRHGNPVATWNSHAPILTSPAVTLEHVYVTNNAGMLYALDRQTLEPVWEFRLGRPPAEEPARFLSSPTVAHGRVYVGTDNYGFLCVGEPGREQPPSLWAGTLGGAGRAGNADESPLAGEAELLWTYPPKGRWLPPRVQMRAAVAVLGEQLFAPLTDGLACFEAAKAPELQWHVPLPKGVWQAPAAFEGTVWCVDGQPGDAARHLHALASAGGKLLWKTPVAPRASGVLLATADQVLVQDREGGLSCFNHKGDRQWAQKLGKLTHIPAATPALLVAGTVQPAVLVALDRPTGRVLWRRSLESAATSSPVVRKDRIYVGTHVGLECRSLLDGAPVPGWKTVGDGVSADFALLRDQAVYINRQGELVVVRLGDGSVQIRLPGAVPGLPPLVSREVALFVGKNGLMRVGLQDETPAAQAWLDGVELGAFTAPMVLVDGRVYAGTAWRGVTALGPR